jgi:acetyl esterase/lipase
MRKHLLSFIVATSATSFSLSAQDMFANMPTQIPETLPTERSAQVINQIEQTATSVIYLKDIVYEKRDDTDLSLQLLMPNAGSPAPKPCMVYIPGSAWFKQNVYMSIPNMLEFAKRGFVVALVEYRHSGIATFPAQVIDTKNAIRFLRKNAARFGIDVNNMFVWGDSSGGHTSLFVGITSGDKELDDPDFPDVSCAVNAIVAYYPPTDISVLKDAPYTMNKGDAGSPEGQLIGNKSIAENMNLARKASPNYYVKKDTPIPPVLLVAGMKDRVVPFLQTDLMAHCLADNEKVFEYYALKDADHGSWQFWTPLMFDKVEAFIRKYIK